jgi:hypothetical protein
MRLNHPSSANRVGCANRAARDRVHQANGQTHRGALQSKLSVGARRLAWLMALVTASGCVSNSVAAPSARTPETVVGAPLTVSATDVAAPGELEAAALPYDPAPYHPSHAAPYNTDYSGVRTPHLGQVNQRVTTVGGASNDATPPAAADDELGIASEDEAVATITESGGPVTSRRIPTCNPPRRCPTS